MDHRPNGFCTDFPVQPKKELLIPAFVNEDHRRNQARQWRANVEEAQIGAAVGAERRKAHRANQKARNGKACMLLMSFLVTLLIVAGMVG